jgi:VWFA-related protein
MKEITAPTACYCPAERVKPLKPISRTTIVVVAALTLGAALAGAHQDQIFRAGSPTVSIYATVVDKTGGLVSGLARSDFDVLDNGKRQDLTVFSNDLQPITLVMMIDRSGSMEGNFALVSQAAEQFVSHLSPADKVRVGSFSDRIQIDPVGFTSDQAEIVRILQHELQSTGITPLWNATSMAMAALEHQDGHRVVLVFTDGHDSPDKADQNTSFREIRDRASAEGIMIYTVGLADTCDAVRRLEDDPVSTLRLQRGRGVQRRPGGRGRGMPPMGMPGGRGRGIPMPRGSGAGGNRPLTEGHGLPCKASKPDSDLKDLAEEGGGGYLELKPTDDVGSTFARIADELHHQYALAFTASSLDGKTHKLEVRVHRHDLAVRARRDYIATPIK